MIEMPSATRMNLLTLKGQSSLAKQGVDLLKRKRDALVAEFFSTIRQTLHYRKQLQDSINTSYKSLIFSKAIDGKPALESLALAGIRPMQISSHIKNVWGVKIPEFEECSWVRDASQRGCTPSSYSFRTEKTAIQFEELSSLLLKIASNEVRVRRIGLEIKKTTRRVNALEQIIIPRFSEQIAYIRGVIEQREREGIFRLKKIKQKLIKKERQ